MGRHHRVDPDLLRGGLRHRRETGRQIPISRNDVHLPGLGRRDPGIDSHHRATHLAGGCFRHGCAQPGRDRCLVRRHAAALQRPGHAAGDDLALRHPHHAQRRRAGRQRLGQPVRALHGRLGAGRLPAHPAALPADRHQPHHPALRPAHPAGGARRPGDGKTLEESRALRAWALVLAGFLFFGDFHVKDSPGQVFETESQYNYIEVQQLNGFTLLRLNDGQGVHSIYHPDQLYYNGPWEQFLVGPFFNPDYAPEDVERYAIIGLAAGTSARQAAEVFASVKIDGFEIDGEIVAVGREYFGMTMPNLTVYVEDGRWGLEHSPHQYDLIAVDAYRPPYIPPHMTTQEFFQIAYDHLTDDGVLAINVGRAPGDRSLIDGLSTTIATVFPSIHIMDIPNTLNSIVYASKQPTTADNLIHNYNALLPRSDIHPLLVTAMSSTIANMQPGYETTQVFTDEVAPIEWMTNNLIVNFMLGGDVEALQ